MWIVSLLNALSLANLELDERNNLHEIGHNMPKQYFNIVDKSWSTQVKDFHLTLTILII